MLLSIIALAGVDLESSNAALFPFAAAKVEKLALAGEEVLFLLLTSLDCVLMLVRMSDEKYLGGKTEERHTGLFIEAFVGLISLEGAGLFTLVIVAPLVARLIGANWLCRLGLAAKGRRGVGRCEICQAAGLASSSEAAAHARESTLQGTEARGRRRTEARHSGARLEY
jgi:hypothetical protein